MYNNSLLTYTVLFFIVEFLGDNLVVIVPEFMDKKIISSVPNM